MPGTRPRPRALAPAALLVAIVLVVGCTASAPAAPTATAPAPTAGATGPDGTGPRLVLVARDLTVDAGACTSLSWEAREVLRVYLDGRGVEATGTAEVCPTSTTTYTLTAVTTDGAMLDRAVTVDVVAPTATPTPPPTSAAPMTAVRAPATPSATAAPTSAATPEVWVNFTCNNGNCDIPASDLCAAVIWETRGVTRLELEQEGKGRVPVGASGRQEVCFPQESVTFYLYYLLPGGAEERRELRIKREG